MAARTIAHCGAFGAVAVLADVVTSRIMYASKNDVAAQSEPSAAARCEGSDKNASEDGRRGLAYTPQFDGLECFETIVRTGKHPRSVTTTPAENWNLSYTPQFDGLECFETIVSTRTHPRSVKQPIAAEKTVPECRGLALAPQFDGLDCFETIISTGKHPRSVKQPSATESVPRSGDLVIAPQFDGLNCFETFVSKK